MDSVVVEALRRLARDRPRDVAVFGLSEGRVRTFADLAEDAAEMTAALDAFSLPDAPCLVSSVGNRTGFIALFLASLSRRASLVVLDGDATEFEVQAAAQRLGAHAIIARADAPVARSAAMQRLPAGLVYIPSSGTRTCEWRSPRGPVEPLILSLTSGSTERPKAVVGSEARLVADGKHIAEAMRVGPDDVSLALIPISHVYGMGSLLMPMLLQGTAIVLRDGFSAGPLADDIVTYGVTAMPGVPFIYDYLRRHGSGEVLGDLRMLVSAGAPLDIETQRFFKQSIGVKIHSLYGTSETGAVTFDDSDDVGPSVSLGRPVSETTVSLVAAETAPTGEGRLLIRGPAVASRYAFKDDGEGTAAFTEEGFLTGDLGRFDQAGRLFLTGRISRFVNVAGRKVQPEEVERVLASMSGVAQASVIGIPHPTRGQMLIACVHRRGAWVTADDVRAACAARLAPHKVPRRIVFADELPVDARGKLDRDAMTDLVTRMVDRDGT